MDQNNRKILVYSLLDGTDWFCLPTKSSNDVQATHLFTFKKISKENVTEADLNELNRQLKGSQKRLNLSKYELVSARAVRIIFSPLKMACVCDPLIDTNLFESANSFVIEKKDSSHFTIKEINKLNEDFSNHKEFDLTPYKIISIQIDTHSPIKYSDYLGQERNITVWSKSIHDETDKLLHYLYKEVSQP